MVMSAEDQEGLGDTEDSSGREQQRRGGGASKDKKEKQEGSSTAVSVPSHVRQEDSPATRGELQRQPEEPPGGRRGRRGRRKRRRLKDTTPGAADTTGQPENPAAESALARENASVNVQAGDRTTLQSIGD